MASNYTTNYGLCQWEAGDQFVRSEFNQDNAKIDAALGQGREALALLGRNTYNLLLREARAGRSVGWQRGLVMEAFLEQPSYDQLTEGFFWVEEDHCLCIDGTVQPSLDLSYGTTYTRTLGVGESLTVPFTTTGSGKVSKVQVYATGGSLLRLSLQRADGTNVSLISNSAMGEVSLNPGGYFIPRDEYQVQVANIGTQPVTLYSASSTTPFGVKIDMLSDVFSEGTYTGESASPGVTWQSLRAWVRYRTGTVSLFVELDGVWTPVPRVQTYFGKLEDGEGCDEAAYALDLPTPRSGSLRLKMEAVRSSSSNIFYLFDCGTVVF